MRLARMRMPRRAGASEPEYGRLSALDFLQTGGLSAESAEIEQLGATDAAGADLLDLINHFGVEGENALYALAEAHFADGEAALRAVLAGNHDALKCLKAFFVTFFNFDLYAHRVAGDKRGQVRAIEFLGKALHDGMDRHSSFLQLKSEFSVYTKNRCFYRSDCFPWPPWSSVRRFVHFQ